MGTCTCTSIQLLYVHLVGEFPIVTHFSGQGPINYLLKLLVFGNEEQDNLLQIEEGERVDPSAKQDGRKEPSSAEAATDELSTVQYCMRLILCIVGLQGAYLTWGVLQVRAIAGLLCGHDALM